jgi:MFS family permease
MALTRKPAEAGGPRSSAYKPGGMVGWLSTYVLTLIAVALWAASLAFVAIALYADQRKVYGAEVLALGWLALVGFNFAWLANPLFLLGALRLLLGKSAGGLTILAGLVSLDTFRVNAYPLNEGGATSQVYGYGWGAVLWFLSFTILIVAAGTRWLELSQPGKTDDSEGTWLRKVGFGAFVAVLALVAYVAVTDRANANMKERQRLSELAFKRGAVCDLEDLLLATPISNFSGLLEAKGAQYGSLAHPLSGPLELLKWGVPAVRIGNRDYYFERKSQVYLLASVPAKGDAEATLSVGSTSEPYSIFAMLTETKGQRVVFERTWRNEAGTRFCPEYSSYPDVSQEPRKLLAQALGLSLSGHEASALLQDLSTAAEHRAIATVTKGSQRPGDAMDDGKRAAVYGGTPVQPWMDNRNCPADVGWDSEEKNRAYGLGWPFRIGDKAYYPAMPAASGALCTEREVYLYSGHADGRRYNLFIEKRSLPDFDRKWLGIVVIEDAGLATRDNLLKVHRIQESADVLVIDTLHAGDRMPVRLSASLPGR